MSDFIFDDCDLDLGTAKSIVRETLRGADDGELFLEHGASESLTFDDGRLKTASFDTSRGFGLRCVAGETTGFAQGTDMTPVALARAAEAVSFAKAGYDTETPSQNPRRINTRLYPDIDPTADPEFGPKVELLQNIDAYARAKDPHVVQVSATMSATRRAITILRADGARYDDIRPLVRLSVSVTVEKDGRRENGYAGIGGRAAYAEFVNEESWKSLVDEAIRGALVNLKAVPAPQGRWMWSSAPAGPACYCTKPLGTGLRAILTAKVHQHLRA